MSKGKIIVTGGMGYIGSHTVVELVQSGFEAVIVDDLSNSIATVLDGIESILGSKPDFENIDLQDKKATHEIFSKHNDAIGVIHFAALKAVGESVKHPGKYYRNNITSLLNVIDAMSLLEASNLIFSSSCTIYGQPDSLPVTESSPVLPPESPYGATKQMSEQIIRDICNTGSISAISLRYFNPIGAHESALIGELPIGVPNNLLPYVTQTAAGIREKLSVFGGDYDTHDGTAMRDYIHVVDLSKAHVIACERLLNRKNQDNYE
ncbi:MAG: UDP-glucose 4-epimerase GalE, partial [Saprospiraceae bacterium]|nr:UDP-glucose 4-epimerase GalE [Saprospiraceae bacterium]